MPIYKYTTLDEPLASGGIGTNAVGINNAGQIVGEYSDGSGIHGFLLSGGTYTTLNDPLAPNFTHQQRGSDCGRLRPGRRVPLERWNVHHAEPSRVRQHHRGGYQQQGPDRRLVIYER